MDREAFWAVAHTKRDPYWLSGTTPEMLVQHYGEALPVGRIVTEIGVGLGHITRELHRTNVVTAVDITPEALRVHTGAYDFGLTIHDLPRATPADWALCHLVFQHCEERMVRHILRETPLTQGGVFWFQTAYPVAEHLAVTDEGRVARGELIWHTGTQVAVWAAQEGLEVFWKKGVLFNGEPVGWTLFKARRRP